MLIVAMFLLAVIVLPVIRKKREEVLTEEGG